MRIIATLTVLSAMATSAGAQQVEGLFWLAGEIRGQIAVVEAQAAATLARCDDADDVFDELRDLCRELDRFEQELQRPIRSRSQLRRLARRACDIDEQVCELREEIDEALEDRSRRRHRRGVVAPQVVFPQRFAPRGIAPQRFAPAAPFGRRFDRDDFEDDFEDYLEDLEERREDFREELEDRLEDRRGHFRPAPPIRSVGYHVGTRRSGFAFSIARGAVRVNVGRQPFGFAGPHFVGYPPAPGFAPVGHVAPIGHAVGLDPEAAALCEQMNRLRRLSRQLRSVLGG